MARSDASKNPYSYLNRLSTDTLEEMIRSDFDGEGLQDDQLVLAILEVLKQRASGGEPLPNTSEAWSDFSKYYNTAEMSDISLYGEPSRNFEPDTQSHSNRNRRKGFYRVLLVAATVMVLLCGSIAVQAAGIDILGSLATWTEETFHFASSGKTTDQPNPDGAEYYGQVQAALTDCGMEEELIPVWRPDGFEPSAPEIYSDSFSDTVCVVFTHTDGRVFYITISQYQSASDIDRYMFEKDDTPVELYTSGGRTFYILSNVNTLTAAWADDTIMATITGNLNTDEIKMIIDSMRER